ncbi:MAG: putative LPS assembly protein LptD [Gemmatimonadota bacterium]
MNPGALLTRGPLALLLGLALTSVPGPGPIPAQAQVADPPPPDTVQVDSTRLRIFQQLEELARPPGMDSIWFIPDSLLSDSALAERDARLTGRQPRQGAPRAAAGMGGRDSIMTALMEMEGYSLTEYASQGADFGAGTKQLVLLGTPEAQARLIREGEEITADSALVYSDETGKVWSVGTQAVYQPKEGDPVNSARIVFDLNQTRGTANQARTRYNAGAEWILYSDYLTVEEESAYGHEVMFTSCEEEEPHYHFAAKNIKIINDNILVARPVKLYFADVPVAWLPFIAQSTESGRASGILTPTFSINDIVRTSRRYSRRISNLGFYWAISDYMDASMSVDWWSGEHTALTGSYSYNWARQFLRGDVNFRQFWREEGGTERALDASGNWQMDERTSLRFRARYASSNDFVRRNSFDPQEVVQSIDSEGGLSRRFSFGNLSLSANRRQYLSDDRTEMTLPTANFSLSPMTFLKASPATARFYNNMTFSGSGNFRRSVSDRLPQTDSAFTESRADKIGTTAGMSGGLNLGRLTLSSGFSLTDDLVKDVPIGLDTITWMADDRVDQARTAVSWNASLNYQQNLIGSTTLTPSLRVSGQMLRSDTDSLANDFVSAPNRVTFGASLKTDVYGFFPGVGSFEAIRHKVTTGFDFDYAPEVSPTEFQTEVFGAREVGRQRSLRLSLNQTFEAKLGDRAAEERAAAMDSIRVDSLSMAADSLRILRRSLPDAPGNTEALRVDSLIMEIDSLLADTTAGPDTSQEARKVTLLALQTSAVSYDFERASRKVPGWRGSPPPSSTTTFPRTTSGA